MVYESDFYTTRRPYTRPFSTSYTVTETGLRTISPTQPEPTSHSTRSISPTTQVKRIPHLLPYIAHKKIVTVVHTPVHSYYYPGAPIPIRIHSRVRPSVLAAELQRIKDLPRSTHHSYTTNYLNSKPNVLWDDETREIRARADALLRRIHVFVPRPLASDFAEDIVPERMHSDDYIRRLLTARKNAKKDDEPISYYESPDSRHFGTGNLACVAYTGGKPHSRRRPYYKLADLRPADVQSDVNMLSYYAKNRQAAASAYPDAPLTEREVRKARALEYDEEPRPRKATKKEPEPVEEEEPEPVTFKPARVPISEPEPIVEAKPEKSVKPKAKNDSKAFAESEVISTSEPESKIVPEPEPERVSELVSQPEPILAEPEPEVLIEPIAAEPEPEVLVEPIAVEPEPEVPEEPVATDPEPEVLAEPIATESELEVSAEPIDVDQESEPVPISAPEPEIVEETEVESAPESEQIVKSEPEIVTEAIVEPEQEEIDEHRSEAVTSPEPDTAIHEDEDRRITEPENVENVENEETKEENVETKEENETAQEEEQLTGDDVLQRKLDEEELRRQVEELKRQAEEEERRRAEEARLAEERWKAEEEERRRREKEEKERRLAEIEEQERLEAERKMEEERWEAERVRDQKLAEIQKRAAEYDALLAEEEENRYAIEKALEEARKRQEREERLAAEVILGVADDLQHPDGSYNECHCHPDINAQEQEERPESPDADDDTQIEEEGCGGETDYDDSTDPYILEHAGFNSAPADISEVVDEAPIIEETDTNIDNFWGDCQA